MFRMVESVEDAKKRLWAEGYLVGLISIWGGCPVRPAYEDASGKKHQGRELEGKRLAALHLLELGVKEIQFFNC
jgi:hypothetical protein